MGVSTSCFKVAEHNVVKAKGRDRGLIEKFEGKKCAKKDNCEGIKCVKTPPAYRNIPNLNAVSACTKSAHIGTFVDQELNFGRPVSYI